ncbi:ABC transporter substrate-binding protein [Eggerthella sp. NSJ-70]|uniref:ABC transporter substrate-binding protein n=1 Tax=Eggerthella hominis TaxID=2763043 RepID=A0ABR7BV27_9ACTN|nr:ABC transporter substrate-binding protein [Eggerthella hominis]MBC5585468.1 ABC transporter substrate-binding protein [Eggerthella hominis]
MATLTRRDFAKLTGATAATLSLGGLLASCTSGEAAKPAEDTTTTAGEETPSQVIVSMTTGSEPAAGFDPLVSWGCGEHVHEPLIQSTLITTTTELDFKNDLATSYEASEDGMTWTFTIRDDAKFTDGTPLTAKDVAFTINGILNAEASECDMSMVKEAVAKDDTTVVISMEKPFNALLYTLAVVGIVPEHAYGDTYGDNPIGSGRYMLEQWDKGQQVILKANPDYYGEAPKIERVVVVFMEEDASLAAAQSGQVDVAYTSATFADKQPSGYDLLNCASVDSRGISLPTIPAGGSKTDEKGEAAAGNDVTCDLAIRQAINYGVDRDKMIENVLNGYGTVAYSVGDGMPWSSPDMKCATDVEKAKKLLDDGGWAAGSDGIREKNGTRAAFNLYYSAGDTVRQGIAEEFSNQMKDLGIEVSIKGASWDDLYPHQFTDPVVWGWGTNAPTETYNLFYSKGTGNYACYENAATDAYLDEALAKPKVEDSFDLWQKAQWDGTTGIAPQGDAPWVWFANIDHLYFAKENLKVAEQKPHPHGHGWSLVNNVDQWSWA